MSPTRARGTVVQNLLRPVEVARKLGVSRTWLYDAIGPATLYKYFPEVDAILLAWHEQQVRRHLEQPDELRDRTTGVRERLEAVLEAYALIQHERVQHEHDHPDLAALVHRSEHVISAEQHLEGFVRDLVAACAEGGDVRYRGCARAQAAICTSR